ncbi:1-deoxy-D-xylulose-5-phosphate synthase, partial [Butyricicoccus sp. 1XD8-22]
MDDEMKTIQIGTWEILREGRHAVILTFGSTIPMVMEAVDELSHQGIQVKVVNARFIKPMDEEMLHSIMASKLPILTVEEAVLQGGFGSEVLEFASDHKYQNEIERIGIPDHFIEQGSVNLLLDEIGITKDEIVNRIQKIVVSNKRLGTKTV